MDKMQSQSASSSNSNIMLSDEYIPLRLDELEQIGKYSVIYEIARIETILSHTFNVEPALASIR
jgi:hypothetical protein